jgi:oligosaccharide reducing-end xylanase
MKFFAHDPRSALAALPVILATLAGCGAAEEGSGSDIPSFGGLPPGTPTPPAAGAGGAGSPPAAMNPGVVPGQPGTGNPEAPVTEGGTPIAGGEPAPGGAAGGSTGPVTGPSGEPPPVPGEPAPPELIPPPPLDRPAVGGTPNLFADVLGRTPAEVDQKVRSAVNRFFGLEGNDPATPTLNGGARSFYTLPQDASMAFVYAADSSDIRSEGMSYGMFIAVQMDMQQQFDQLWRFAKTFMQYQTTDPLTSWHNYFRWRGTVNSANANNWAIAFGAQEPPASDGEEYFAAALYLANRRWGSGGAINYKAEADVVSDAMLNNPIGDDGRYPLIHPESNQVTFVPYGTSAEHSDPSYHLPAFYEIFAEDGPPQNSVRWRVIAEESRDYFVASAHPETGLHPDYATFDGAPEPGYNPDPSQPHDQFRFDAWRVPLNMAVEYAWSRPDPRLGGQIEKYVTFFGSRLANGNVSAALFRLDGGVNTNGGSQALVATLAAATLASQNGNRMTFVDNLWNIAQPTGQFRYYQGAVYLLGLLAASGNFDYGFE